MNHVHIPKNLFWPCGRPIAKFKGAYPLGFLRRVEELVGVQSDEMLHLFGGTLQYPHTSPETWVSGSTIPFDDDSFRMVLCDPPYSKEEAADLYGRSYKGPYSFAAEAARVCRPGGYVGILSRLVYSVRWGLDGLERVSTVAVTTGPNMQIRVFCLFQKPPDWAAPSRNNGFVHVTDVACPICYRVIPVGKVRRGARYCSNACRQKGYRQRGSGG